ncbi:pseudouridine synthase [Crocosphaera sp. UHCC 0190]|uniref:pseudouridine synthase n=1 Tax=Crocosphaera sp. UHCC 0190 TaxID=3110246 RepID=UPI002B1E9953|nr:pseudouridine synthase [Crocosphaera sp. UHCC 0190]MEA5510605.1 pseudouridine synthase [Crocosphaera sp. UHCC 0190]
MNQYILFNKPYGVLCQFTDKDNPNTPRPTLKDYIPIPDIYSVGRLDFDSEGLLLLTNNGPLKHRLSHREFAHPRTYWVQVERIPDEPTLNHLRQGVQIKDYCTRPAQVKLLATPPNLSPRNPPIRYRKTVPTSWLEITLTEGRNRQVRRMTAAIGYPTLRLVRVSIGFKTGKTLEKLSLGDLKPGEWREATKLERHSLENLSYQ